MFISLISNKKQAKYSLPVFWMLPPDDSCHNCSNNHHALPEPEWQEDKPEATLYRLIKPQSKHQREDNQTCVHQEFTV